MKIGLVIKDFAAAQGGGERYTVTLVRELVSLGHQVTVFARNFEDGAKSQVEFVPVLSKRSDISKSYSFALRAEKEILKRRSLLDIVYGLTQSFGCDALRLGGGLSVFWEKLKYKNAPWKKYISITRLLNRHLEKRMFHGRTLKMIAVNSTMVKKQLTEHYVIGEECIRLIRNGVDPAFFSVQAVGESAEEETEKIRKFAGDALTLLFAANNYERKGLFDLLRFMALNKDKDFRLIVAGRGDTEKVKKLCGECGIAEKVFLYGFCSDMRKLLYVADAFVLPTYYDPFSNACMEAACFGLPVITTRLNGFSELIQEGKNGFIMDEPEDYSSLDKAVSSLKKRKNCGEVFLSCREAMLPYTPRKNAEETLLMLRDIPKGLQ
jgi:UDP-glucose:(heptosyl)LPS alpha-1,3-glucosyltransferase